MPAGEPRTRKTRTPRERTPLSRDLILRTAVDLADAGGLAALSMRKLAERLRVEAMSLYYHVSDKEDLLDGMVDSVFAEIDLPPRGEPWQAAMRRRAVSARVTLARHPWALGLMESRANAGPATLRHHDAVIGSLRAAGFTIAMAARAYSLIDSYVYGFALQAAALPFETTAEVEDVAATMLDRLPAETYPHLTEMIIGHALKPGYSHESEFEAGLDLILDGLERQRRAA
jgi:AcrR family transcriptional regulator